MNKCQEAANAGGNKLELTVSNCNDRQIKACLANADAVVAQAAAAPTSSPAATTSQPAPTTSSPAAAAAAAAVSSTPTGTATRVSGDYQTFTGAAGGITAPAVTTTGNNKWVQSGSTYDNMLNALQQSCYAQAGSCAASQLSFDKSVCWSAQVNSCLDNAKTTAASYTASVSAANLAQATMARTVPNDAQTYTGALGKIPAPAVTGTTNAWRVDGLSQSFWNLEDAISQSCWVQQDKCGAAGGASGWAFELTTDNCYNKQINACLANVKTAAANYGKAPVITSTTSTASTVNAASLASYSSSVSSSLSASASAYSSSVSASVSASASAYSSSISASASASAASASASASASAAAAAAAALANAKPSVPVGWVQAPTFCVAEGSRGRALVGASFADNAMTWEKCTTFCAGKGFAIAGVEVSNVYRCNCQNTITRADTPTVL